LAPGVEPSADVVSKPAGEKDQLQLAPQGCIRVDQAGRPLFTPVTAAAIDQASASRQSPRPPSKQAENDSSSVASSTSSTRPGAVRVEDTESNHDEWTLQTQEEPDTEQGFETILPISAVLPDAELENNQTISEAQIVVCGQPRWLIFTLLGVLLTGAISASLGIAHKVAQSCRPSFPIFR
jgi:hypothetical protein